MPPVFQFPLSLMPNISTHKKHWYDQNFYTFFIQFASGISLLLTCTAHLPP